MNQPVVDVIIPALNEGASVTKVIADINKTIVREIVVVDNDSTDDTASVARLAGATVLTEKKRGYGAACLTGIRHIQSKAVAPDIIVFLDSDYSDHPEEIPMVIEPIINGNHDLVIGSRALGNREAGSLTPQQLIGNRIAVWLIRLLYGIRFTDLGPFRAIRWSSLLDLGMKDETYGWTVEMQIKAVRKKLRCTEVPVSYRRRIGVSKVSGTVRGTFLAGYKIITTIFKYA
ncbi:MAG: glycosyltransferase family 2 protein [Bacteroidetes bacterium]|nr:glycosyltransferase family 2 protein [Bacteroidota bacterium]